MEWIPGDRWLIRGERYTLRMAERRPALLMEGKDGVLLCELFLVSSIHAAAGRDLSSSISPIAFEQSGKGVTLRFSADSTVWERKEYTLFAGEDGLTYDVCVTGRGALEEAELLSGYYSGSNDRCGTARHYSGFPADSLMNPEPDGSERRFVSPLERTMIDLMGVPIPGRDHWFFTPPPFCFVLRKGEICYTLGVTAKPGHHTFTEYEYLGGTGGGLRLRYEGYQKVDGRYDLPRLYLKLGTDEYGLLAGFSALERRTDTKKAQAAWWQKPIFCGWGAQCAMGGVHCQPAPLLSRQEFYETIGRELEEKNLHPGILVIDDKWQKQYGLNDVDVEKWPDMKGFISAMHGKGRKVLLWLKAWDPQGVAPDLCIRDFQGNKLAVDPTHPGYVRLFGHAAEYMLSPQGLDADGFKIDFTARIPSGPGCRLHDHSIWGLELMRAYLAMVYDQAKRTKEDALIMCHCPHPYLQDKCDMIRLNDVNMGHPVNPQMVHRARVAAAAMPDCLIDTDNWPMPDKAAWLSYVKLQPGLGVPSLYYLWQMDNGNEAITGDDLDAVRESWQSYERGLHEKP